MSRSEYSSSKYQRIPFMPLRDVVLFPTCKIDLIVGRKKSLMALTESQRDNRPICVALQKSPLVEVPTIETIYPIGVIATLIKVIKISGETCKISVVGHHRVKINELYNEDCLNVNAVTFPDIIEESDSLAPSDREYLLNLMHRHPFFKTPDSSELSNYLRSIDSAEELIDVISGRIEIQPKHKQELLSLATVQERFEFMVDLFKTAIQNNRFETIIKQRMIKQIEKSQKDFYIQEQIKALQKELGDDNPEAKEINDFEKSVKNVGLLPEAKEKATKEIARLKSMPPSSPEASVIKSYLGYLLKLPWKKRSKIQIDINNAKEILDRDHHALNDIKDRILEFLAVQKRVKNTGTSILCLIGPPGVGKTSLARSIAVATKREFVKMSLGGVRDEAEIRGHRKTYIGAMPGKIITNILKAKVKNPVFLLDEIDKTGNDFRGDPSSALLEVLDPEQNSSFTDHYLEVGFDLSEVLFITTANTLNIPKPLLDRLEVIHVSGYTDHEKYHIAQNHLIQKQIKLHGITESKFAINKDSTYEMIRYYTRESGVRSLERIISKICRKFVFHIDSKETNEKNKDGFVINQKKVEAYLGPRLFRYQTDVNRAIVGQVTGLAWTEHGGEILQIEAITSPGKGATQYTGSLGTVMKESIDAALSIVKKHAPTFNKKITANYFSKQDFHVHVPEGAIPKDGPSAGLGMTIALFSTILDIPVYSSVAMTGEVTLSGQILPIGGLREKLLAAQRANIKKVLIPLDNCPQLDEVPNEIKQSLTIVPVEWLEESFSHLFDITSKQIKQIENKVVTYRSEQSKPMPTHKH